MVLARIKKLSLICVMLLCSLQVALAATHPHHPKAIAKKHVSHHSKVSSKHPAHHRVKHPHLSHAEHAPLPPKEMDEDETIPEVSHNGAEAPVAELSAPHRFISSLGQHMVNLVHSTIATLSYTAYKLGGTHFDRSNGVYVLDCSDYVDHLLQTANPLAYHSLVNSTGTDKPTSAHYYDFFTGLTYKRRHYWNKVEDVKELQPGDILVFRNKRVSHTGASGHVMVVMDKPTRVQNAFIVRVTDSASSGHSQDTRSPHTSGIGIGTMQLKVNPENGHPSAYAWKLGSAWEKRVNFAMARPVGD
jgi:cell wall-associated NlpC family hydrolase